jgi:hypothetical protein
MPPVAGPHISESNQGDKRRRAEIDVNDSTGEQVGGLPSAKRHKNSPPSDAEAGEDETQLLMHSQQNLEDLGIAVSNHASEARIKKKRKKKKKKVPVVQQNGSPKKPESSIRASVSPAPITSSTRAVVQKQPTPGPSHLPYPATSATTAKHEEIQHVSISMPVMVNPVKFETLHFKVTSVKAD